MSTNKQPKRPQITSPKGTFRFPKLSEPDFGNQKFPKPDGEYSVQLVLKQDSPEFDKFFEILRPHYEAALEQAEAAFKELPIGTRKKLGKVTPNDLFTTLYDKETEEPTGEVAFKAAAKASGERKHGPKAGTRWNFKPAVFDAKGKYLSKAPEIWGGTVGRISVEVSPYFIPGTGAAGLKMHLVGAQIIDLVQGGQRNASDMGFGSEEGGYEHEDAPSMPEETITTTDASEGDF
jgi:hypothetical protein